MTAAPQITRVTIPLDAIRRDLAEIDHLLFDLGRDGYGARFAAQVGDRLRQCFPAAIHHLGDADALARAALAGICAGLLARRAPLIAQIADYLDPAELAALTQRWTR